MDKRQEKGTVDPQIILEGKPLAQCLFGRFQYKLAETVVSLAAVLTNLSNNADDIDRWAQKFEDACDKTYCDILVQIGSCEAKVASQIKNYMQEIKGLCETLQISMPYVGPEMGGLYQMRSHLEELIEEYNSMIKSRYDAFNALNSRQLELCQSLRKQPQVFNDYPLPTKEEVEQLQRYVDMLEKEWSLTVEEFYNTQQKIIDLVDNLKYKPTSNFEVVVIENAAFEVTTENLDLSRIFHRNLEEKVKKEINHVWRGIEHLWNILNVDDLERTSLRQKYKDCSYSTLVALRAQREEYEGKKRLIRISIEKLRDELKQLWEKCHFTKEQGRDKFPSWHSNCYTKKLSSIYEMEIEKCNNFYKQNEETFQLIEKHKQYGAKMIELELKSADPNRLKNRGAQLLKDEKDRHAISKEIPLLEEQLITLSEKFRSNNQEFTTFGLTIAEYLDNMHADIQTAKQQKLSSRKQKGNKVSKMAATEVQKKKVIPKLTIPTVAVPKRRSSARESTLEQISANNKRKHSLDSTLLEYREFSDPLSERMDSHSDINPFSDDDSFEEPKPSRRWGFYMSRS